MGHAQEHILSTCVCTRRALIFVFLAVVAFVLSATNAFASAYMPSSARSAAMGGAYTALAKGVDAVKFNPANLGLSDYRTFGIEIASLGASITNNSFTLSDYNRYTGATLSTSDKQELLGKIPKEGLSVDADVRASALSVALGNMSLSVSGVAAAEVPASKSSSEKGR